MKQSDLYWLAGLLEGEGSFMKGPPSAPNQPRISLSMTDEDVVVRVAKLFNVAYISSKPYRKSRGWKPCFQLLLRGSNAIAMMRKLRPLMGYRRKAQIDRSIKSYTPRAPGDNTRKLTAKKVLNIRRRLANGEKVLVVANDNHVSRDVVRKIRDFRIWKSVRLKRSA